MNPGKPVMIYDGACAFCKRWVLRWAKMTENRVLYKPYQEGLEEFPELSREDCIKAVQFVDVDGKVYSAAEAVFKSLTYSKRWGWLYGYYIKSRFFAGFSESLYRWVARNRR